jgi:Tol biopolymer transport system component
MVIPLSGCGDVKSKVDAAVADSTVSSDAAADAALPRCNPTAAFGTPQSVDALNSTVYDGGPWLSPDELKVYFSSDRTGPGAVGNLDVYVATRSTRTDAWGTPVVLAGVNTTGTDQSPRLTADGLFLYVTTHSAATGYDIFVAQRANATIDFPLPSNVPTLNAAGVSDASQWVLPDNSALYFHSNRSGSDKTYRATRNAGGTFDQATLVTLTTLAEASPVVSADELTIYFGANTGGTTGYDIYMAKRNAKGDAFGTPQVLAPLTSNENEFPGWVSADGCEMYFNRVVTGRGDEIFRATRGQ